MTLGAPYIRLYIDTVIIKVKVIWLRTGREEVLLPSEFMSEMASVGKCSRIQVQCACCPVDGNLQLQ